jgi:uncharacterized protein (DUF1501 family)
MCFTRRAFLKSGALAIVATAAIPSFLTRAVFADTNGGKRKRLVLIFQRGAADGLNIVLPYAEPQYYKLRPNLAVPPPGMANGNGALDLDGFFGLHPAMASFQPLWRDKHLAIVHAAGSPDSTRSHFDAQDYMESGTPGVKSTEDGWLNRTLHQQNGAQHDAESPFRAVAMGTSLPRIMSGSEPAVALNNINEFGVAGRAQASGMLTSTFESMYASSVDTVLHGAAQETFDAVKMLKSADPAKYTPASNAKYPRGRLGDSLRQLAQLMKADLGVEVAFADIGGWDHHVNEAPQLNNVLREFSQSISAFWYDLGPLAEDTVIVTMSEFGRTARENGNRGTDHGHANVMFVLGGPVRGGRVYGKWPGLEEHQLNEGRDLALTTDFRTVMGEAVGRQMGVRDVSRVFPGFTMPAPLHLLG